MRRLRMFAAVARQGFELCGARERPSQPVETSPPSVARAAAARVHLRQRRDEPRRRPDPAPAGAQPDRADHRRERHRQGPRGARHSRRLAAARGDVSPLQLHDDDARAGRQSAVRPSPRQLHRRDRRPAGADPHRRRRHVCSSTRSATCRSTSSRSCCGSSSRAKSCRSARRGRRRSTSACWPRPTPTWNSAWRRESFARTCTTGCASSAFTCRRCASGARRSRT